MNAIRTMTLLAIAVLMAASAPGPAGSGLGSGCGPVFSIQDPQLRAMFAEFDRTRTGELAQVCALARNSVGR